MGVCRMLQKIEKSVNPEWEKEQKIRDQQEKEKRERKQAKKAGSYVRYTRGSGRGTGG